MKWHLSSSQTVDLEIIEISDALSFKFLNFSRKIIIIDSNVHNLYKNLLNLDSDDKILILDCGEQNKNLEVSLNVLSFIEDSGVLRRSEPVIAIGGGVLLDIVGFCCSIYRRGIPYIRIPTTLLSIVDASVGAKTGINHFDRRNRLGSYFLPKLTAIDKKFIGTQTSKEISNGLAEILKVAIILDNILFSLIEDNVEKLLSNKFQLDAIGDQIINRAISCMLPQLESNLWETNLKRCVDFGHTFSPVIEMKNVANLLHGEAVIMDCLLSSCISNNRGLLCDKDLQRIFDVTKKSGLPTKHLDFENIDLLLTGLSDVMKHRNNNQYITLPNGIGNHVIVNNVSIDEIQRAILKLKKYNE